MRWRSLTKNRNLNRILRVSFLPQRRCASNEADSYADVNTSIQGGFFSNLISRLNITPGLQCLDIGCGTGNNTMALAQMVGDSGHVIGIDLDEERIKVANEKYKRANVDYICGRSTQFPIPESGYDLVISNAVMMWVHYEEKIETYERIFRSLKPGGECGICEVAWLPKNMTNIISCLVTEEHDYVSNAHNFLTAEENREIFTNLGYEIVQITHETPATVHYTVDEFLDWFHATYHGRINVHRTYHENSHEIELDRNKHGFISSKVGLNYMVTKKGK